jgi:Sec-independent protein translocase protein TatA
VLAILGNVNLFEFIVILAVALMIFGKRLPEIAMRAVAQLARARRALSELWRQAGLEEELRRVQRELDAEKRKIERGFANPADELREIGRDLDRERRALDRDLRRKELEPPRQPSLSGPAAIERVAASAPPASSKNPTILSPAPQAGPPGSPPEFGRGVPTAPDDERPAAERGEPRSPHETESRDAETEGAA